MTDEVQNDGAQQEIANPETSQQDAAVEQNAQPQEGKHFANLRRKNDELQRKLQSQEEMLQLFLAQKTQQQSPQPVQEDVEVGDDEYVQGSKFKKAIQQAVENGKKAAREETKKLLEEQHKSQFLDRLKKRYNDFDDVVNPETLAILEEEDPDLASTIAATQDPYTIGLQSYKYIKALGLVEKAPKHRRVKEVDKAIEANSKKVQSPQAFDKRPMAQAFELTKDMKTQLYEEMNRYAAMSGGSY